MVKRKGLLSLSLVLLTVYALAKEIIFVDSAHIFLAVVGLLSIWFVYELGITSFEAALASQAEVVLKQFEQALEIELKVVDYLIENNKDYKTLSDELLSQILSSLEELSYAIKLNYQGLGNFFDLCVQEYLQFLFREIAEFKIFLYKISVYSLSRAGKVL